MDERLLELVREHVAGQARTAAELAALREQVHALEAEASSQTLLLARLVALQEARDAREAAVADAQRKRVDDEIAERRGRTEWRRAQVERVVGQIAHPVVVAFGLVLSAVGSALAAWVGGVGPHGGPKP